MHTTTAMSAFDQCLNISAAHARIQHVLDDALGTFHGLSYADFMLLHRLADAPHDSMTMVDLAPHLGLRPSAVVRQVLPLEKIGLVLRGPQSGAPGRRQVTLRPAGRQALAAATETARALCQQLGPFDGVPG
jgi:DNA-binding MarR family transcriptional regulator